ncbi:MAG: dual specificity protein phosphatase family protein [candidate division NC10 bacterium]|nr:dual specificity protein phosphatase family protein [candidate division NC10 bacterium]
MADNFSFVIEGRLAGMARPGCSRPLEDDIEFLKAQGIGAIVSMTEGPLNEGVVRSLGLRYLHLPVPDYCSPTIQQIEDFLAFLDAADSDGAVVVHCYAGQGRTGTMLACALVQQGMSAEDAIRIIRAKRPPSIDTFAQEQVIFEFAAMRRR